MRDVGSQFDPNFPPRAFRINYIRSSDCLGRLRKTFFSTKWRAHPLNLCPRTVAIRNTSANCQKCNNWISRTHLATTYRIMISGNLNSVTKRRNVSFCRLSWVVSNFVSYHRLPRLPMHHDYHGYDHEKFMWSQVCFPNFNFSNEPSAFRNGVLITNNVWRGWQTLLRHASHRQILQPRNV